MSRYLVELLSDLNEEVSVYVEADNEAEAEAIGVAMLEDGKLYCISQICLEATAVLVGSVLSLFILHFPQKANLVHERRAT